MSKVLGREGRGIQRRGAEGAEGRREGRVFHLSDSVTIILGDCKDTLGDLHFDALVSDPPYGINYTRGAGGQGLSENVHRKPIHGDDVEFDPRHLLNRQGRYTAIRTPAKPMVLFGANHYCQHIPHAGQWLVWDKSCGQGPAGTCVDAEFIWMNRRNARNVFHHFWMGACRAGEGAPGRHTRTHPSEKPMELMMWLLSTARIGLGRTVVDPYMGSGTTGIACIRTGRKFIGIEIDPEYFETAKQRLQKELANHRAARGRA